MFFVSCFRCCKVKEGLTALSFFQGDGKYLWMCLSCPGCSGSRLTPSYLGLPCLLSWSLLCSEKTLIINSVVSLSSLNIFVEMAR